ncbi:Prephenate dehydratase [Rubripirellula lacrimiformis]|uniref:prephenate dehydratase n=1 Tax=Rubripirellula lacrimiformis TaxID=1930273 RepID=A0A517NAM5_9BACT|nr:prephenate dehydratase [Rubripirellula lacrimiformis]QDT04180.1 Prephenate dehydratase [Rubripirellula lacrimiformis]
MTESRPSSSESSQPQPSGCKQSGSSDSGPQDAAPKLIQDIDLQLIDLFQRRAEIVRAEVVDHDAAVVGRVASAARQIDSLVASHCDLAGGLPSDEVSGLLRHLSSVCLQSLHELRVAYLGPEHSYSHLAALKYFGDAVELVPVSSIPAVFESVQRGDVATGMVPIENSTDGRVVDTLGMFVRREMQICGEVLLPIHHNLLSKSPRNEITHVYSKPQALSQCRAWLTKNLPAAQLVEISSTAAAAELASQKLGIAAVASLEAGRQYELDVIDVNIEDNQNNVTRFAVLGKERQAPTGDDKTAILFQVSHVPGALADAMVVFKKQSLNLTWIESFPSPDAANEYLFFVELSGHRDDPAVAAAIQELAAQAQRLTVLGAYPKAKL